MMQTKITSYLEINNNKKRKFIDSDLNIDVDFLTKKIMNMSVSSTTLYSYKYNYTKDKLIYKHPNINLFYDIKKESFYIKSDCYIAKGTLICIEEGIIGDLKHISFVLQNRKDIAKELHPRKTMDLFTSVNSLNFNEDELYNKIIHNSWEWKMNELPLQLQEKDICIICPFISKFNHSCIPNAFVRSVNISSYLTSNDNKSKDEIEYKGGIVVYAVNNINPDEEITVSYGFNVGHNLSLNFKDENDEDNNVFNWICECNKPVKERFSYFRKCYQEAKFWWNEDKDHVVQDIIQKHYNY